MAGYTSRQQTYTTGDTITAADTNDEFDAILAAMNASSGHAHDGTSGEGPLLVATGALDTGSITANFGAIDNGVSNITTGGILKIDVDGTAENAAGSLTLGAGNDAGIYFDGTNLVILTNGAGASGIILDTEDDTLEIKGSGVLQATFDTSGLNLVASDAYYIGGTSVLNATTLGTAVVTSSLTTVGTIGTGVWNGTSIAAAYMDAATLTAKGAIEIATIAETNTGTDATRAVSPDGLEDWTGSAQITTLGTIATGAWNGTAVTVAYGGTGATTLTDGGVLLGSGTGAITAMGVLANGEMIVGDGTTDPVAESGATLRTSIGLGTFATENIASVPALTLAGTITGAAQTISDAVLKDTAETTVAKSNFGATPAWDVSAGNAQWGTVDQAITSSTMTNWPATGATGYLALEVINGGAFSIAWPTSVDWVDGTAPTLTASGTDQLVFRSRNAGTTVLGWVVGLDIK